MSGVSGRAVQVSMEARTRYSLYLDPTESDILSGIRYFHPDLFVEVDTVVTVVEFQRHTVKYSYGERFGLAALDAFGFHHSVDLSNIYSHLFEEPQSHMLANPIAPSPALVSQNSVQPNMSNRSASPPGLTRDPNNVPRMTYNYDASPTDFTDVESNAANEPPQFQMHLQQKRLLVIAPSPT